MKEKKNIDRLFQEKLKDFEVHPQHHVWEHIEAQLKQKEKDRKVIPIWWRLAGVAATLVVMLGIGFNIWNRQNNISNNTIVNQETKTSIDDTTKSSTKKIIVDEVAFEDASENKSQQNESTEISSNSTNSSEKISNDNSQLAINNNENAEIEDKTAKKSAPNQAHSQKEKSGVAYTKATSEEDKTISNQTKVAENKSDVDKGEKSQNLNDFKKLPVNTAIVENQSNQVNPDLDKDVLTEKLKEEKTIEEAIAELEELTNEKEKEAFNRWRISPNVAPVYFNSLGEGSNIHSQFNENGKSSNVNMSYGIAASYAINKKLKIRAGISNVNLDYRTNDVMTSNGLARSANNSQVNIPNIKLNQNSGDSNFMSSKAVSLSSAPEIIKSNMAALEQQFGFIEVPLEMEYSLLNKKLGLNVIGGFSTFFLNNNNLFLIDQSGTSLIGESANLNDVSYSANFGLGMFYNFSKALQFNLEPMFKYQINTFNNTSGDFQPFFMGVYTGLSFKF